MKKKIFDRRRKWFLSSVFFFSPVVDKVEVEEALKEKVNKLEKGKDPNDILLELKRLNPQGLGLLMS